MLIGFSVYCRCKSSADVRTDVLKYVRSAEIQHSNSYNKLLQWRQNCKKNIREFTWPCDHLPRYLEALRHGQPPRARGRYLAFPDGLKNESHPILHGWKLYLCLRSASSLAFILSEAGVSRKSFLLLILFIAHVGLIGRLIDSVDVNTIIKPTINSCSLHFSDLPDPASTDLLIVLLRLINTSGYGTTNL